MKCPNCGVEISDARALDIPACPECSYFMDVHRMMAAIALHKPYEEVTPEERRAAKSVNWGLLYSSRREQG